MLRCNNMRFPKIRKDLGLQDNNSSKIPSSLVSSILKRKWTIVVLGIAMTIIGLVGAIYYGSQYIKQGATAGGGTIPYTAALEIVFVVIGMVGFGILIYGIVGKTDNKQPVDSYRDEK
jgi:hypothetical protein